MYVVIVLVGMGSVQKPGLGLFGQYSSVRNRDWNWKSKFGICDLDLVIIKSGINQIRMSIIKLKCNIQYDNLKFGIIPTYPDRNPDHNQS